MKRILLPALAILISHFAASAQSGNLSILKLRLSDRSGISVNLDGRFIDRQTTSLTLDGIRSGLHHIEVYASQGYRRRPVRIYTGTIRLAPATVNAGVVDIYSRGLSLRSRRLDEYDYADHEPEGGYDRDKANDNYRPNRDGDGSDDVYDNSRGNRGGSADGSAAQTETGVGSFPHGRGAVTGSINPLTRRDMDDLHSRISSHITDTDKEQLLKSVIQNRNASTEQIREMLLWLAFDSTRLDFAKWAYPHASDRSNYWKLEDVFSFDSSKKEFSESTGRR